MLEKAGLKSQTFEERFAQMWLTNVSIAKLVQLVIIKYKLVTNATYRMQNKPFQIRIKQTRFIYIWCQINMTSATVGMDN